MSVSIEELRGRAEILDVGIRSTRGVEGPPGD